MRTLNFTRMAGPDRTRASSSRSDGRGRAAQAFLPLWAARVALAVVAAAVLTGAAPVDTDTSRSAAFAAANNAAMTKMMSGMDIQSSGDIDRDFVAAMIPHHQGAIDMAVAELRYGSNERLRRIAQEIVVAQQQEIAAMHLALDQPLPPSAPAPTQVSTTVSVRTAP